MTGWTQTPNFIYDHLPDMKEAEIVSDIKCEWCGVKYSKFRKVKMPEGIIILCVRCRYLLNKKSTDQDNKLYAKSRKVRDALVTARGRFCQQCGRYMQRVHGHHLVPIRKGGDNDPSNILLLCRDCHELEHSHGVGA